MLDEDGVAELLGGAVKYEAVVSSWLGGTNLAESVPVDSGSVAWSTNRDVPGSLDLVVPRVWHGFDWVPGIDDRHPLARFGQQLWVSIRVTALVSGTYWDFPRGKFLITDWDVDAGTVQVTGESLTRRLVDAGLRTPTAPRAGGTIASELKRLVAPHMGLIIDPGLVDRPVPAMSWGESRFEAVKELADAWPARLREDGFGNLHLLPPLAAVPVPLATLTDDDSIDGIPVVVAAYQSDSRSGAFNVIVARGQEQDDAGKPAFQEVASVTSGPLAIATYGEITGRISSQAITSRFVARQVANAELAKSIRRARTIPVTLAADPRWEVDDAVAVHADGFLHWGYVSGLQIPLVPDAMRMDVEIP